jgi:hypothetical protein
MPAFIRHWFSAEYAHAWPWATIPGKEFARPAAEAALENWAAEVLAYVGLMLERERPDWTARFAVTVSPLDI